MCGFTTQKDSSSEVSLYCTQKDSSSANHYTEESSSAVSLHRKKFRSTKEYNRLQKQLNLKIKIVKCERSVFANLLFGG